MGLAKNDMINCEERGYGHCDKRICRDCICNKTLTEFIKNNGYMSTCDYCGEKRKVVTLEDIMEPIMSGIRYKYELAENCLPYSDGGYLGTTYDTYDLFYDCLQDELPIENEDLLNDLYNITQNYTWCEADYSSEKVYETELYLWHRFCDLVKNHMRYVFYKSNDSEGSYNLPNPVNILDTIGMYVQELKPFKRLPQNFKLYRGRLHDSPNELTKPEDFGPPPSQYAKSNRMSAEGIPLFYAAFDEETALKEIYNAQKEYATVASFKINRPLTLIDLPKLQNMQLPSIFDEDNREKRSSIIFLKEFAEDISRKIDQSPSIEYVPTQIITEYFRYVFQSSKYGDIDGIIYKSSQNPDGYCVVLFMSDKDFLNDQKCMVNKETVKLSQFKKSFDPIN